MRAVNAMMLLMYLMYLVVVTLLFQLLADIVQLQQFVNKHL